MVEAALKAKELLKAEGINAGVINIHTLKPIDKDLIVKAAKETGAIVTAEEHSIIGGLGSAVSEVLCEEYPVPVVKVGIKDTFGESGKPAELLEKYGLTAANIVEKVDIDFAFPKMEINIVKIDSNLTKTAQMFIDEEIEYEK